MHDDRLDAVCEGLGQAHQSEGPGDPSVQTVAVAGLVGLPETVLYRFLVGRRSSGVSTLDGPAQRGQLGCGFADRGQLHDLGLQ